MVLTVAMINAANPIAFVDSHTRVPKPEVDAGRILVSSAELGWQGVQLVKGENEHFTPDDVTVVQHYFAMNVGPAYQWEWKDGDRFKTHSYETGDVWVNPAGVPFSHRIDTYNQFVVVTIDPAKVVEILGDRLHPERQAFRRQHRARDKQLQTLIQALLVEAEAGAPNGTLYADMVTNALATHFVNHYSVETPTIRDRLSGVSRGQLQPAIDFIEASLTKDMSLDELAAIAGLSKFHFARLFKQTFGLSPHQYVIQRRIERAAISLQRGEQTILQIAHNFGFSDQSHFTRAFKKVKGTTPKQFLK
ncbi:MAG: AraC family transcriptional regulator [Cyanobacteria bacterium J06642_2]